MIWMHTMLKQSQKKKSWSTEKHFENKGTGGFINELIIYTEWHSYWGGACLLDSLRALPCIKADLWLHNHNC